jgi:hypothetical protein
LRVWHARTPESTFLCSPTVAIAVRNASGRRRWPKLREWLRAAASRSLNCCSDGSCFGDPGALSIPSLK